MSENTDYYILQENDKYVMYYSIAQICIAIVAGSIQVIFIKKCIRCRSFCWGFNLFWKSVFRKILNLFETTFNNISIYRESRYCCCFKNRTIYWNLSNGCILIIITFIRCGLRYADLVRIHKYFLLGRIFHKTSCAHI